MPLPLIPIAGWLATNIGVPMITSEILTKLADEFSKEDPFPKGMSDEEKVAEINRRANDQSFSAKAKRFLRSDEGKTIVSTAPYFLNPANALKKGVQKGGKAISNIFNKPKVKAPQKNTPGLGPNPVKGGNQNPGQAPATGNSGAPTPKPKGSPKPATTPTPTSPTGGGATPKPTVGGGNTFSPAPTKVAKPTTPPKGPAGGGGGGGTKPVAGGGAGTKPNPATPTPKPSKFDTVKKYAKGAGALGTVGAIGYGLAGAMGEEAEPAEEETKPIILPNGEEMDPEMAKTPQGQALIEAQMQNQIDRENGVVDFNDPAELIARTKGMRDTVTSGTRQIPNRMKQNLMADAGTAIMKQRQDNKVAQRKQATADHNATRMLEDPRMAEIKQAFNDTSDLREDGVLWEGLDDAEKQQMVRNYYMNETNSSQKRQKLQDIAGEDALIGNIYKDGRLQAGDANYATDEYFANKKGFNKENFTKGTGLQHAGTGIVGTNLEDTVNEGKKATLEMGSRFDDAGGEETAQPFLSDAQKAVLGHHNARPGTYTDKFGQQSAMNKDTRRITSDDQDYGDAVFNSPQDAVAYHNRSKEESPEQPPEDGTETTPVVPTPPDDGGQGVLNPSNLLPIAMRVMSKGKVKPKARVMKAEAPTPKSKSFDAPVPKQATPVQQPARPVKTPAPQPTYKTMTGQTKSIPQAPKTADPMMSKTLPKNPLDIPAKSTGLPGTVPRTPASAPSPTPTKPRQGVFDQGVPKTNPKTNMNNGRVEVAPNNRPRRPNFDNPEEELKKKLAQQALGVN